MNISYRFLRWKEFKKRFLLEFSESPLKFKEIYAINNYPRYHLQDDGHLNTAIEFLSLDELMALLLETNPFLQEIILLSNTKNNQ